MARVDDKVTAPSSLHGVAPPAKNCKRDQQIYRLRAPGRRCGRTRRAEVGVPGGRGVRTGWCQMRPETQPRAPRPFHGSCECSRPVSGSVPEWKCWCPLQHPVVCVTAESDRHSRTRCCSKTPRVPIVRCRCASGPSSQSGQ